MMTRLLGALTHNWGLKLLALILAIIVFYGVRSSRHDRTSFWMKGSSPVEHGSK